MVWRTGCANFVCNLLSWMLDDSYFSFRRSIPFPNFIYFNNNNDNNKKMENLRIFLRMWMGKANIYSFSGPIVTQSRNDITSKILIIYFFALN